MYWLICYAINKYIYCSIEKNIKFVKYWGEIRNYNKVCKKTDLKFKRKIKERKSW